MLPCFALGSPGLEGEPDRGDVPEVQILAHVRDVVGLRLVAVRVVVTEALFQKAAEDLLGLRVAPLVQVAEGADATVEVHPVEDLLYIREIQAVYVHVRRPLFDLGRRERDQEVFEVLLDLRPERPRRVLLLAGGELDGHDHVGLDLRDETIRLSGDLLTPLLLRTHVTAVRDDERGVLARLEGHLLGGALADDHLDAALF